MSRFPDYEGSNSGKYSNALHASYHQEQYKVLDSRATLDERVHVSAAKMEEYHEVVEELSDRSNEALASPDTEESRAQDSERDRILSMLFFLITSGLTALDKAVQAAEGLAPEQQPEEEPRHGQTGRHAPRIGQQGFHGQRVRLFSMRSIRARSSSTEIFSSSTSADTAPR